MDKITNLNINDMYEKYITVMKKEKPILLNKGSSYFLKFNYTKKENISNYIQLKMATNILEKWRREDYYSILYRRICESIENDKLVIKGDGKPVSKNIYYKVYPEEILDAKEFNFEWKYNFKGIAEVAKAIVEIKYADETSTIESDNAEIVETFDLDMSNKNSVISAKFIAKKTIDFIFLRLETESLKGILTLDSPTITTMYGNIVEPFKVLPQTLTTPRWVGENLSKFEWIPITLKLNGNIIFDDYKFDRVFAMPAEDFNVPQGILVDGINSLEIIYRDDYNLQPELILSEIAIIEVIERGIVNCPETVCLGELPILIKAKKGDNVSIVGTECIKTKLYKIEAEYDGLNVIKLDVVAPFATTNTIKIFIENIENECSVYNFGFETKDVYVGTGDMIYIDLTIAELERFLEWYLGNHVGNMVTFRTSYRWSGCRYVENGFWERGRYLLDNMNIHYNVMIDGRELNAAKSNCSLVAENSKCFDGYQSHEQDGAYCYWKQNVINKREAFFNELISRRLKWQGLLPSGSVYRRGKVYYKHFDNDIAKNMKQAHDQLVNNFEKCVNNATRHTGPSVFFKYFIEAGIKWLGAELMYGPFDPVIAFMRGVSRVTGNTEYGGHIAIQWSTTPHDTIYRYRRYLLSLYNCYLNGVNNINTEEGLYRIEERYAKLDRDSVSCRSHMAVLRDFYKFVINHNYRGEQKVNIGFLHGKYDGFNGFNRSNVYAQKGLKWKYSSIEKSWDLLNEVFYIGSKFNMLYRHPCQNRQQGYFASTPYGQIDVIPTESNLTDFKRYPYLLMLGFNTADEPFIENLAEYVEDGGTLVLAIPHLYTTIDRKDALRHNSEILLNETAKKLLGIKDIKKYRIIKLSTAQPIGLKYSVSNRKVLENNYGKGKVIFVNRFLYPYQMKKLYKTIMQKIAQEALSKEKLKGAVTTKDWVTTSIFDLSDRRIINLLDTNWWKKNKQNEKATIFFGGYNYVIEVTRDILNQVVIFGDSAVQTMDNTTYVENINKENVILRGIGETKINILHKGILKTIEIDFGCKNIKEIKIY